MQRLRRASGITPMVDGNTCSAFSLPRRARATRPSDLRTRRRRVTSRCGCHGRKHRQSRRAGGRPGRHRAGCMPHVERCPPRRVPGTWQKWGVGGAGGAVWGTRWAPVAEDGDVVADEVVLYVADGHSGRRAQRFELLPASRMSEAVAARSSPAAIFVHPSACSGGGEGHAGG
jgi:hypothetical protein